MGWNWDAVSLTAGQIQACIRYTQSYARCMYTPLRREHAGCACDPSICTSETCNLQPASRGPRQGLSSSQETSVCGAVGVWAWEPAARHARGSNGVLLHRRAHITCNQGNQAINQRHSARTASAALHATQFQFKGQTEKDYQRLKREIDVMMAPGLRRLVRPVITKGTWHGLSDFGSYSAVLVILLYSGIAPIVGACPSSKHALLLLLLLRLDVFRAPRFADDSIPPDSQFTCRLSFFSLYVSSPPWPPGPCTGTGCREHHHPRTRTASSPGQQRTGSCLSPGGHERLPCDTGKKDGVRRGEGLRREHT